jgi:exonuclease VII small subunit
MIDLRTIKFKGGFFENEKALNFFGQKEKNVQGSLVFGRNGSGKSTITKLTRKFKESLLPVDSSVSFFNEQSNEITPLIDKDRIFIFDEDFIDDNIRFKSNDGLETIVMIGDQIDVEEEIKSIKGKVASLEKTIENIDINVYTNPKNVLSPLYFENAMINILKSNGGWARIDSNIKGNTNKTSVNSNVLENIINANKGSKEADLKDKFSKDFQYYETIRSFSETLETYKLGINLKYTEAELIDKLKQEIEKPIGDKWVDRLNNASSEFGSKHALNISSHFVLNKEYCPFCLRDITEDEIETILSAVRIQQNIDIEVYRLELDAYRFEKLDDEQLEIYSILPDNNMSSVKKNIKKYNSLVVDINNAIDKRLDDVFKIINLESKNIDKLIHNLEDEVLKLNQSVKKFNEDVNNSNTLRDKLISLNMEMSFHQVKALHKQMKKQQTEKTEIISKFSTTTTAINKKNAEISTLRSKQKNIDIAVDLLNKFLGIIFFSKNRLKVLLEDGQYKILSNKKIVAKQNLSTGERNAIALCYFFSLMNVGLPIKDVFKNELKVFIDDPVSSFDIESRIGIFSFLKTVLGDIVKGNEASKVIVFSHKIDVYLDMIKVFCDIANDTEFYFEFNKLENQELKTMKSKNIYNILLKDIYKFSINAVDDSESIVIGNKMRRVLESFSTFNYGISSIELTKKGMIEAKIDDCDLHNYFINFMQRLLLNNESHMEETIYSLETQAFYTYVDFSEKLVTAKSVICMLYLFDKTHVISHLFNLKDQLLIFKDKSVIKNTIETWIEEIKSH